MCIKKISIEAMHGLWNNNIWLKHNYGFTFHDLRKVLLLSNVDGSTQFQNLNENPQTLHTSILTMDIILSSNIKI